MLQEISPDLENFGHRVATDIHSMGKECELQPPRLEYFDAWGQRVDNIHTCQGWKQLHDVAAEEGLISIAFERKYAQWRYMYEYFFTILYIFLALPQPEIKFYNQSLQGCAQRKAERCPVLSTCEIQGA